MLYDNGANQKFQVPPRRRLVPLQSTISEIRSAFRMSRMLKRRITSEYGANLQPEDLCMETFAPMS